MYTLHSAARDRYLAPGTLVRLAIKIKDNGFITPESGVVLHCWQDEQAGSHQALVAFFGAKIPKGKPLKEPHIVQHTSASLAELEQAVGSPQVPPPQRRHR